ncbi:hypothetical protein [Paracoccus kondratievae]|uniref:Uncharacterized protein n=1 Tax=Paracoccus kondratievae TaxID=135740 RepID=A0AAD3NXA4_9RHOB|nr:hypothetical protein [Paracoccus kondratievae]AZV00245.1 cysteine-rich zinc finger protein [Paracoccus phage vB_PkoS_Pkon1]GLK63504.1 hypothetical protein GCM10017635_09740 [Paracoccus kondratievae]
MLHHTFPHGRVEMDGLSVDLTNLSPEDALLALDRADDKAFDIWKDMCSQISEARDRIQNTGSIFGNAKAIALASREDNPKVCNRCLGKGGVLVSHPDTGCDVWNDCPQCYGTRRAGPVILP